MSEDHDSDISSDNVAADGSYIVGKGKPPESGKFRKGDNRPRGRRAKGTANLATDFAEEMAAPICMTVNGKRIRVSRQRSILMRLADCASRGQLGAIRMILEYELKFCRELDSSNSTEEGESYAFPALDTLCRLELEQLESLLCKAAGQPFVPRRDDSPLAYVEDASDERNYHKKVTLEGLVYRCCSIPDVADELIEVRNNAYLSAALPRWSGCYRGEHLIGKGIEL